MRTAAAEGSTPEDPNEDPHAPGRGSGVPRRGHIREDHIRSPRGPVTPAAGPASTPRAGPIPPGTHGATSTQGHPFSCDRRVPRHAARPGHDGSLDAAPWHPPIGTRGDERGRSRHVQRHPGPLAAFGGPCRTDPDRPVVGPSGRIAPPGRGPPGRGHPWRAAPRAADRLGRLAHRLRVAAAVLSAVVVAATGVAWAVYRDVTAGITTTDVIAGGWAGGGQNILLVGVDSRTDAQGNPLPDGVLAQLHSGAGHRRDQLRHDHPAARAGGRRRARWRSPSRATATCDIPGYRQDKINAAYPAVKARPRERLVRRRARATRARIDRSPRGRPAGADRGREELTGVARRPLRRDQPARLPQPDQRDRRRRRVPEGAGERPAVRRPASPPARRRSPARTRWRSSGSGTGCPRATCPGSAASRCSWPRSPTRCSSATP